MKLFKKLAAVTLAAVLALSMVGCGAAKSIWKDEIINILTDYSNAGEGEYKHTDAMDKLADALVKEAGKKYEDGAEVSELLASDEVVAAAKLDATKTYIVSAIEDYEFKSSATTASQKFQWLMNELFRNGQLIGTIPSDGSWGSSPLPSKADFGVVNATFGGTNYVVVLMQAK